MWLVQIPEYLCFNRRLERGEPHQIYHMYPSTNWLTAWITGGRGMWAEFAAKDWSTGHHPLGRMRSGTSNSHSLRYNNGAEISEVCVLPSVQLSILDIRKLQSAIHSNLRLRQRLCSWQYIYRMPGIPAAHLFFAKFSEDYKLIAFHISSDNSSHWGQDFFLAEFVRFFLLLSSWAC